MIIFTSNFCHAEHHSSKLIMIAYADAISIVRIILSSWLLTDELVQRSNKITNITKVNRN